jgi:hypothetical protein
MEDGSGPPTWWRGSRRTGAVDQEAAALWLVAQHLEWLARALESTLEGKRPTEIDTFRSHVRAARLSYAKAQEPLQGAERVVYLCNARITLAGALAPLAWLARKGLVAEGREATIRVRIAEATRFLEFLVGRATQAALPAPLHEPPSRRRGDPKQRPSTLRDGLAGAAATRRRLRLAPRPREPTEPRR